MEDGLYTIAWLQLQCLYQVLVFTALRTFKDCVVHLHKNALNVQNSCF